MKKAKQQTENTLPANMLYITSDTLSFLDRESAMKHAEHLADKTIATMTADEANEQLTGVATEYKEDVLETLLDEITGHC